MIKIMYSSECTREQLLSRTVPESAEVDEAVRGIIDTVREKGDSALFDYALRFDKAHLEKLEVSREEIEDALAAIDAEFLDILKEAKQNIWDFHSRQKREGFRIEKEGIVLGQRILPLERVGIYVPGGTASYPSTVLMNAIPARIAGVKEIIMTTPPAADGKIKNEILAAAYVAGVDRIFKVGGAGAIAALAYGTESIPAVDKIVGPGNVYVATAKRFVFGKTAIDMVAGPSEIFVIADESATPSFLAADLLSQAEHDRLSSSVLATSSRAVGEAVAAEIEKQLPALEREEIARASIEKNGRIIITESEDEAVELANAYAPEHLQLAVKDPFAMLQKIKNAGSVFLGHYAPEPLGDYFAGPNHTLPTSGTARFSSPLGVDDFVKRSSFISYTEAALESVSRKVAAFAEREGLTAHAGSIKIRFGGKDGAEKQ